jgi:hypothetical protein
MVHGLYTMHPSRGILLPELGLTINSITENPYFAYLGGSKKGLASVATWPAYYGGGDCVSAGSGNDPIIYDYACKPDGGKVWEAQTTGVGDLTTEDFVLEMILDCDNTTSVRPISKRSTALGWRIFCQNAGAGFLNCTFEDSSGTTGLISCEAGLTPGTRYHMMLFVDRSGYAQWYRNGILSNVAVDVSARQLSISNAVKLVLCATYTYGSIYSEKIGWICMWKRDAWLDTHLQGAVALARYNALDLTQWST